MTPFRLALAAMLLAAAPAWSQTGRVTGTVTDSTSAVIPGVEVRVTQIDTGAVRVIATNAEGVYNAPLLQPGRYRLTLQKDGFKPLRFEDVLIETNITRTVDAQMELGEVAETITVESAAALLEAESSTVGQLIERAQVINMPIESRRAAALVRLTGAVVFRNESGTGEQIPYFSIAGGRSQNQMWHLDGTSVQNAAIGVAQIGLNPSAESLQEFKVEINNLAAEYGRTGGGFILMTTRSGTNEFRGAAYEFLRNDALDARTFFAPRKAPLRYNIFGVSVGGPIRRDNTFFFFNWEGSRRRDGQTFSTDRVPHPENVQGDFSRRTTLRLLDPLVGTQFANNTIPQSRMDPVGRAVAALYPAPNVASNNPAAAPGNNFVSNVSDPLDGNMYTARVDHMAGAKDNVFARFTASPNESRFSPRFAAAFADPRAASIVNDHRQITVGWIHTFKPNLINDFRYNWGNRSHINRSAGFASGKNGELGIRGVDPSFFATIVPAGLTQLGASNHERVVPIVKTIEGIDNLTWIAGKHQMKTGFSFRYSRFEDEFNQQAGGRFVFNDRATGDGLASLLLGWTTGASILDNDPIHPRTDYISAFVQDDWKIGSRLTLNLGLRWEMDTPRWEEDNKQSGFDIRQINPVSGRPGAMTFAGRDGVSKYAHSFDRNNFGPRFGFAWRPFDTTVVRGGYGVMFYPPYIGQVATVLTAGFSNQAAFDSPDGGLSAVFRFADGMPPIPPGEALTPSFGAVPLGRAPRFSPQFLQDNHSNAYAHQWNFTVQRQMRGNSLVEAAYLGNVAHKLSGQSVNLNMIPLVDGRGPATQTQAARPYPHFNTVELLYPNWGNSSYHALNVKWEKRYGSGLSLLANYTWSKFLDDVESVTEYAGAEGNGYQHIELRRLDKGYSGNHMPHRYITSVVYDLPFGKGRRYSFSNGVLDALAGGWGLGGVTEFRSGSSYGAVEQTNRSNTFSHSQRPNLIGDPALPSDRPRGDLVAQYFDTAAFAAPGDGVFGSAPRTFCCGPGAALLDLSAFKWFSFTERYRLQLRGDFFNIANRPNFAPPAAVRGRGDFGRIGSIAPGTTGRQIQLALRFEF